MKNRLVLLLGEYRSADNGIEQLLREWSLAGLLGTVAWTDVGVDASIRPGTSYVEDGELRSVPLFDLLTSRIWSQVSVVGVRQQHVGSLTAARFERETQTLEMVQNAFDAHKDLEFQSFTVSIAEQQGLIYEAFSPYWKMHILHEPVIRIDQAVAAQPMWDDDRHLLVTLLALTMAGGFVWQPGALAPDLADQVVGVHRSIRVGRSYLRVVSAGRLTDEVLAGAFPKSGPWSIPADVPNALAVPPGTGVTDSLIEAVVRKGKFTYLDWRSPEHERPKTLNMWEGLKLFAKEFGAALRGIPVTLVAQIKQEVERFVQATTFGDDSKILLRFDPTVDSLDPSIVIERIKTSQIDHSVDPISDPEPWNILQRVALGAVDGGVFPEGIPAPLRGSNRLVYTDPLSIGPSPEGESFEVSTFEATVLNLDESQRVIGSMDVTAALTLKSHLQGLREKLTSKPAEVEGVAPSSRNDSQESRAGEVAGIRRRGRLWRWRLRLKERRELKKARKRSKKSVVAKNYALSKSATPQSPAGIPGALHDESTLNATTDGQHAHGDELAIAPGGQVNADLDANESERHMPSHPNFRQSEYSPVTEFYQGDRAEILAEYAAANLVYQSALSSHSAVNSHFVRSKTCDHCGTKFDHGLLYLHEPSKKLVHVGSVCARKSMPGFGSIDLFAQRLENLEQRFGEWLHTRSSSLLWRVGEGITAGLVVARRDLANCLQILASRPSIEGDSVAARIKFGRWTRRGVLSVLLVIAAALASVVLTPFPLLIAILVVTFYFSGFVIRMLYLARDIVRSQYKFQVAMGEYERAYSRARHDVSEVVRLSSVSEQFQDWQFVVRELVHLPFGREIGFAGSDRGIDDVTRPPAMILGKSRPDEKQRMQLFLQARRQTIHGGWLTEILDILKEEWRNDYENVRLTTSADNILPESDNAPSGSVVGKRPLSDEDVYFPRTDFRRRVSAGDLQRALVSRKAEQVAIDLRQTAIGRLLAKVEVSGLGAALNGLSVEDFLAGLSSEIDGSVAFPADLISDRYPNYRLFAPELVLPNHGSLNSEAGQIQVQPGVELTAAAWKVELSAPLDPLEILRGFETVASKSINPEPIFDGPSPV